MPPRGRPPLSPMDAAQFTIPCDRQIHSLPRRAQHTKRRPTPCESRPSKEPPCKVRRLEYRQPGHSEKNTFRSYREPTRIPSDTTTTTDGWGSSEDDASTDRTLTEIERELGNGRESSPTSTEAEGDEVDNVLRGSASPSPCPIKGPAQAQCMAYVPSDARGEKRRRRVESFRGQKRRKSEVSSDEETDTSDDEIFAGWDWVKEAKVKSPKITTVYVPQSASVPPPPRALGPSASVAELARRIRCLDAAGSDIIMQTDSEGEEDEAMVSASLYSLPAWAREQAVPIEVSQNNPNAKPNPLRLALIKRRELRARWPQKSTKAPHWARASASDPNRAFWAKYMYATTFARVRARSDEYGEKLPGQRSNRYLRKVPEPYTGHVPRPGPPKGWAPNALCLGQINIYLIRETVQAKRHRRNVKLAANAWVEPYLPPRISYRKVRAWWEEEDPEPVEPEIQPLPLYTARPVEDEEGAVEEGLLPPIEVGHVDLQAAEVMYNRSVFVPDTEVHEIVDEVEDVEDEDEVDAAALIEGKRARSESVEPRESTEDRNRRINEDIAVEMERRAALHARREAQVQETREPVEEPVGLVAPVPRRIAPVSLWSPPIAESTYSGPGQVLGSLPVEAVESSASSDQDELESILAPESEPPSTSSTSESDRSDPPNYDDLHPIPVSLPIRPAVLATLPRRQAPAHPPPYQVHLPLRGSAYDAQRTPSPPPPFNAQTDALTIIAPRFVPFFLSDDEDEVDPVLARLAPSGRARAEPVRARGEVPPLPGDDVVELQEREREQRLVGSFPRPSTPETPTPTPRARRERPQPRPQVQPRVSTRSSRAGEPVDDRRPRLTEHALRQHTRALAAQSQAQHVDSFDAARDMESANELEAELEEVDQEEAGPSLVSGLRRWVGRFWG